MPIGISPYLADVAPPPRYIRSRLFCKIRLHHMWMKGSL
jgi:hypothetical protein